MKQQIQKHYFSLFKKSLILLGLIFWINNYSYSQLTNPFQAMYVNPGFGLEVGFLTQNFKYGIMDVGLGYEDDGLDLSAYVNLLWSPSAANAVYEVSDGYYYKVKEKGQIISLNLEKRFNFIRDRNNGKYGLYIMAKPGYYWSIHKGLNNFRKGKFLFIPGAGVSIQPADIIRIS